MAAPPQFGITGATEAWRQEYARRNVRFSVVEPGLTQTELVGHQQPLGDIALPSWR